MARVLINEIGMEPYYIDVPDESQDSAVFVPAPELGGGYISPVPVPTPIPIIVTQSPTTYNVDAGDAEQQYYAPSPVAVPIVIPELVSESTSVSVSPLPTPIPVQSPYEISPPILIGPTVPVSQLPQGVSGGSVIVDPATLPPPTMDPNKLVPVSDIRGGTVVTIKEPDGTESQIGIGPQPSPIDPIKADFDKRLSEINELKKTMDDRRSDNKAHQDRVLAGYEYQKKEYDKLKAELKTLVDSKQLEPGVANSRLLILVDNINREINALRDHVSYENNLQKERSDKLNSLIDGYNNRASDLAERRVQSALDISGIAKREAEQLELYKQFVQVTDVPQLEAPVTKSSEQPWETGTFIDTSPRQEPILPSSVVIIEPTVQEEVRKLTNEFSRTLDPEVYLKAGINLPQHTLDELDVYKKIKQGEISGIRTTDAIQDEMERNKLRKSVDDVVTQQVLNIGKLKADLVVNPVELPPPAIDGISIKEDGTFDIDKSGIDTFVEELAGGDPVKALVDKGVFPGVLMGRVPPIQNKIKYDNLSNIWYPVGSDPKKLYYPQGKFEATALVNKIIDEYSSVSLASHQNLVNKLYSEERPKVISSAADAYDNAVLSASRSGFTIKEDKADFIRRVDDNFKSEADKLLSQNPLGMTRNEFIEKYLTELDKSSPTKDQIAKYQLIGMIPGVNVKRTIEDVVSKKSANAGDIGKIALYGALDVLSIFAIKGISASLAAKIPARLQPGSYKMIIKPRYADGTPNSPVVGEQYELEFRQSQIPEVRKIMNEMAGIREGEYGVTPTSEELASQSYASRGRPGEP